MSVKKPNPAVEREQMRALWIEAEVLDSGLLVAHLAPDNLPHPIIATTDHNLSRDIELLLGNEAVLRELQFLYQATVSVGNRSDNKLFITDNIEYIVAAHNFLLLKEMLGTTNDDVHYKKIRDCLSQQDRGRKFRQASALLLGTEIEIDESAYRILPAVSGGDPCVTTISIAAPKVVYSEDYLHDTAQVIQRNLNAKLTPLNGAKYLEGIMPHIQQK